MLRRRASALRFRQRRCRRRRLPDVAGHGVRGRSPPIPREVSLEEYDFPGHYPPFTGRGIARCMAAMKDSAAALSAIAPLR